MLKTKEKKLMYEKVTRGVGNIVARLETEGKWTLVELSNTYKVNSNRLSEYKNFDIHKRKVSESDLLKMLSGGMFTMNQLKKETENLTDRETSYLEGLEIYYNPKTRKIFESLQRDGVDIIDLLEAVEQARKKVDVIKVLKNM